MIMKNLGKSLVAVAIAAAASMPLASHASDNPALDECVERFVQEVVPANHSVEIRHADIVASTTTESATRSRVMLIARGEKNGKVFGRASCVMHRGGSLIAMYLYDDRVRLASVSRPKVLFRNG
jgi:hypothetical protein